MAGPFALRAGGRGPLPFFGRRGAIPTDGNRLQRIRHDEHVLKEVER